MDANTQWVGWVDVFVSWLSCQAHSFAAACAAGLATHEAGCIVRNTYDDSGAEAGRGRVSVSEQKPSLSVVSVSSPLLSSLSLSLQPPRLPRR